MAPMVMGDLVREVDVVVVGGGPGGYSAAFRCAELGLETVVVDAGKRLGGACLFEGCIPSKALLHVAAVLGEAERAKEFGVDFGPARVSLDPLRKWKSERVIARLARGLVGVARSKGVEVVGGRGVFEDARTVRVEGDEPQALKFRHVIVATGSAPARLGGVEATVGGASLTFDRVLFAVGRGPRTAGLGLETTRAKTDARGFLEVDARCATAEPRIFAVGDATGEPMLAHRAMRQGKVAAEVIAGRPAAFDNTVVPAVVFTDPEIAWCGLTETRAAAEGRTVRVAKFQWAASGRAATLGRSDGVTKLVVDPESGRLLGSGIRDDEYKNVGAELTGVEDVWRRAELILKVKEPVPEEYPRLRAGQVLFTYLHLAPAPELTRALRAAGTVAIAYETVQRADGSLPLLTPMSEVAGRLAVQEGAFYLGRAHGGRGILLSGVPGVPPGNVVIIGAGTVGVNAARIALGLGADVSILDVNPDRLRAVDDLFAGRAVTIMSNAFNLQAVVRRADLLIGAVLITGARAPVLVTAAMVATMKEGAVIVDVAVDQGGCVETVHPTTLLDPVYVVSGVVHYGVANMPALVPRTSTFALTNATLPYALELAGRGVAAAARANAALARGINVARGRIVHPAVAASLGEAPAPLESVLG